MMRPDTKVEKAYLFPKPVDFRKSIDNLAAWAWRDARVTVFDIFFRLPQQATQSSEDILRCVAVSTFDSRVSSPGASKRCPMPRGDSPLYVMFQK